MLIKPTILYKNILNSSYPDKIILLTIFLFPIMTLSVRHWLSGLYSLQVLMSLILVFNLKQKIQLHKEEKILFVLFGVFIFSFILSASLNGWSDNSYRRIGNVLKYVAFFPFYLLIRQYASAFNLLLAGIIIGGVVFGINSIYDVFIMNNSQATGIYGPIVFGDLAVLYFSIILIMLFFDHKIIITQTPYLASLILLALTVFLSGSRNAWLAAIFSLFAVPLLCSQYIKYKKTALSLLLVTCLAIITMFALNPTMNKRLNLAYTEFVTFTTEGAPKTTPIMSNSIGFRLEQWRVALIVAQGAPLLGYGGGNAGKHITHAAEKGLGHPDLINQHTIKGIGGLHSTYFESLVNEGIVGLIIILIFLLYPAYIFMKTRKHSPIPSTIGLIFILNYMIFGLTENPFVHDNFTSVYLLFLAIFFSAAMHEKYQNDIAPHSSG